MGRISLFLGQCGESVYFWDSLENQLIFGTVWRISLFLEQFGESVYFWDSVELRLNCCIKCLASFTRPLEVSGGGGGAASRT